MKAFSVGDRVRIKPGPELSEQFHNQEGVVVEAFEGGAVIVKMDNQKLASTRSDGAWIFAGQTPERYLELISHQIVGRQEKPCQVCQHMNDTGINTCYWCGNHP